MLVEALFRYPVKSMAGESLDACDVGWYGLDGDRRRALHRIDERGGMPWLVASKLSALLRYTPQGDRFRAPEGRELTTDEAVAEIARLYGHPVEMMRLDHGIFDETPISVITTGTVDAFSAACGRDVGVRRFRPNIVVRTEHPRSFEEDDWVGSQLAIGEVVIAITQRDERCAMLNLDPDTAESDPSLMKFAVRANDNKAGVYGTVIHRGRIAVGDRIRRVS